MWHFMRNQMQKTIWQSQTHKTSWARDGFANTTQWSVFRKGLMWCSECVNNNPAAEVSVYREDGTVAEVKSDVMADKDAAALRQDYLQWELAGILCTGSIWNWWRQTFKDQTMTTRKTTKSKLLHFRSYSALFITCNGWLRDDSFKC